MALLDHFRPPLSGARHWESFDAAWAGSIADALNEDLLPAGYFAEEHVHVGSRVEIDVATFTSAAGGGATAPDNGGALATATRAWAPPVPTAVWPAVFPDSIEVLVFSGDVRGADQLHGGDERRPGRTGPRPAVRSPPSAPRTCSRGWGWSWWIS
jgi:hypothetical protein